MGKITQWLTDSHLAHPALSLAVIVPAAMAGHVLAGAVAAIGFYYGREVAQVERHAGDAGDPRWWAGFDWRGWTRGNHLDFWPVVMVAVAGLAIL